MYFSVRFVAVSAFLVVAQRIAGAGQPRRASGRGRTSL